MAYSAALNAVYNHYLAAYAPMSTTRYDTHKKSELRSIYNSIVKLNKDAPLYLPNTGKDSQRFAVGLKENARQLRNTIASLGGLKEEEMLNKRTAYFSNSDLLTASFIGDIPEEEEFPTYNIEVFSLASGQINKGNFLPSSQSAALQAGVYSFDITVNDFSYEFQYGIQEGDTHRDIQNRLARLISSADIGLRADVVSEGNLTALRLSSTSIGLKGGRNIIFSVSDHDSTKQKGSVAYFGLNSIATPPSNAEFSVNGRKETAFSNHITVDKLFEVQLLRTSASSEDTSEIGIKADVDSLTENVGNLVDGYNSFLESTASQNSTYPKSRHLVGEMGHIAQLYGDAFQQIGISYDEHGVLSLDKKALREAVLLDNGKDSLNTVKGFANSVLRKVNQVSLNPMQYVEKTIVAYKNPGHNFIIPYMTSAYSGMMFNTYC